MRNSTLRTMQFLIFLTVIQTLYLGRIYAQVKPIEENIHNEESGFLLVEADEFYQKTKSDIRKWYLVSSYYSTEIMKDSRKILHTGDASGEKYIEILPNPNHLINREGSLDKEPGKLAVLHYKVKITNPGRYYIWTKAYTTGNEDNSINVGVNGYWPEYGRNLSWCDGKNSWYWESKQGAEVDSCVNKERIYIEVDKPGIHDVQFSTRNDGFKMDQWIMTQDELFNPRDVVLRNGNIVKNVGSISGELKKWHKVTITFDGPETSESHENNPFFNYRMNVLFTHVASGKEYLVPGYFAADGNAAETSATQGNKWKVNFAPDEVGEWNYSVDFRKGNWVAVSEKKSTGVSGSFMDGSKGSFMISKTDKSGADFRAKGRLQYLGGRYLRFSETGDYFLKEGPDAPENFLAYEDFDGTFHNDGHKDNLVKTWSAHTNDWKVGDPTWKKTKGKGIIGALNYLASKDLNSISFLTNNILGDDQNVFPYVDYDHYDRFDISKLEQWEIVFEHAQKLGLFLNIKTLEMENQGLLDNGGVGAYSKLYYRELIARFGHHMALNWNLGEENGEWVKNHKTPPQFKQQRLSMAQYFSDNDPYHHHLVIHNGAQFDDVLGAQSAITGPSIQTHRSDFKMVHSEVLHWIRASKEAGKQWAVAVDEPGDAEHGLIPDDEDIDHDVPRKNALWGTLMAGGWGCEWYFGYAHAHSDLTCQDFRSRDKFWDQTKIALDFFMKNNIPFWEMENNNALVDNPDNENTVYCLAKDGKEYVVYLNSVPTAKLDLTNTSGFFEVYWYNPKKGGDFQKSKVTKVKDGSKVDLGKSQDTKQMEWAILIRKLN